MKNIDQAQYKCVLYRKTHNLIVLKEKKVKLNKIKFDIARARTCKGTKELEAAGIPRGTLCTAMSGKSVRPETIGRIAKALGGRCNRNY